LDDKSF
jgi:hypothetical protein